MVVVSLLTTHLNVLFYNNHFIISDLKRKRDGDLQFGFSQTVLTLSSLSDYLIASARSWYRKKKRKGVPSERTRNARKCK